MAARDRQILTPSEAARLLGRSRSWVEKSVSLGALPARRIGSRWWLTVSDLRAAGWLDDAAAASTKRDAR
jgi:excisionase family DNA binding protein